MYRLLFFISFILCCIFSKAQPSQHNYSGTNNVAISVDSVVVIKRAKGFKYMASIDSLLKDRKIKNSQLSSSHEKSYSLLENILNSGVFKIIVYLFAGALLAWIVFKFWGTRAVFKRKITEQNNLGEKTNFENLNSDDFIERISGAINIKDYRVAIKYYYLQTLMILSEKELVIKSTGKTNNEYLHDLPERLKFNFSVLIKQYNYVWYGKMDIDEQTFLNFQNNFINFQNIL